MVCRSREIKSNQEFVFIYFNFCTNSFAGTCPQIEFNCNFDKRNLNMVNTLSQLQNTFSFKLIYFYTLSELQWPLKPQNDFILKHYCNLKEYKLLTHYTYIEISICREESACTSIVSIADVNWGTIVRLTRMPALMKRSVQRTERKIQNILCTAYSVMARSYLISTVFTKWRDQFLN